MHQEPIHFRLGKFLKAIGLVFVIFIGLLFKVQVVDAGAINEVSSKARTKTDVRIPAVRGNIVDSAGHILATTVTRYDVNIDPSIVSAVTEKINGQDTVFTKEQVAGQLAILLKIPQAKILSKFLISGRYANLAKAVDAAVYRQIEALRINWVSADPVQKRVYPGGALAGNLLGFVGSDGTPLAGIEREMNACLAGTDGKQTYVQGADGIIIPESLKVTQPARNGNTVVLNINSDLQYYAQQVVADTVMTLNADWASGIVIEAKTGKILAAAEAPTVDPNAFWKTKSQNLGSRIFQFAFEPGSIMKTVSAATALDVGVATPATRAIVPDRLRTPWGQYIYDSEIHGFEKLTLTGVLRDSSNVGIVKITTKVPLATRFAYLKRFGLGAKTGVGFEGESSGLIGNYKNWDKMTDLVSAFGQGIAVTPIQTAMMYQTVANQGVRLAPTLVAGCKDASGGIQPLPSVAPETVITPETAASTMDMLEKVVEFGPIGRTAQLPGYRIGGKTGTAQVSQGHGYGLLHAISFVGIAPAENPQYIVAVTAYKSRRVSNSLGITPAFRKIMLQVLRTYRVPPSSGHSKKIPMSWN
jgi:cell division protein FtsI (penicillin-binding protein 3)